MIKHDYSFLPVLLAPLCPSVMIAHNFALFASSVHLLNWHIVQLLQILLDFRLRQKVIDFEVCNVVSVGFL